MKEAFAIICIGALMVLAYLAGLEEGKAIQFNEHYNEVQKAIKSGQTTWISDRRLLVIADKTWRENRPVCYIYRHQDVSNISMPIDHNRLKNEIYKIVKTINASILNAESLD